MRVGSVVISLSVGLALAACGESNLQLFVPRPDVAPDAASIVYLVSDGGRTEVFARSLDDPSPLRPSVPISEGPVGLEALVFDESLEALGLLPGLVPSLPAGEGVSILSLQPTVLATTVSEFGAEDWRPSTPSSRAATLRVRGPCPRFDVLPLDDLPFKPIALSRPDSIQLLGLQRLVTLRFEEGDTPTIVTTTTSVTIEPRALLLTDAARAWVGSTGRQVGVLNLEPLSYEYRFSVPEYPDLIDPESGVVRTQAIAAMAKVGAGTEVLAATSGGVMGLFDETSEFVRRAVASVSGRQARIASIVSDGLGRHLVTFSAAQGYFAYADDAFTEVTLTELGTSGASLMARTASHGTLIFGRYTGVVLRETAVDEWEILPRIRLEFEAIEALDFRDGFLISGEQGELAFYSERTGLCMAEASQPLLGAGNSTSAVLGDWFVRAIRYEDESVVHRVVAVHVSQ